MVILLDSFPLRKVAILTILTILVILGPAGPGFPQPWNNQELLLPQPRDNRNSSSRGWITLPSVLPCPTLPWCIPCLLPCLYTTACSTSNTSGTPPRAAPVTPLVHPREDRAQVVLPVPPRVDRAQVVLPIHHLGTPCPVYTSSCTRCAAHVEVSTASRVVLGPFWPPARSRSGSRGWSNIVEDPSPPV